MGLFDLDTWTPALLTAGLMLGVTACAGSAQNTLARALFCAVCVGTDIRYLIWRSLYTIPAADSLLGTVWVYAFYALEVCSLLSSILISVFMSRALNRSIEADRRRHSPLRDPPVDVFIATYNEGADILERTIVGAKAIRHTDLRIWVLDDGDRLEIRQLAADLGVEYAFRIKGKHAKAGNVNNGLRLALATGRSPEFILLLDADFVARPNILERTLGFFEDLSVGIVQTPQHFFNHDPIQVNLSSTRTWPDEQRFFFNYLLACKDAWGAAFCCGTSAVFRVEALEASGGMATETVTEDMLTTFQMQEYGYRTIFLNEHLSSGLAPEGLVEFVTQRSRWCLGAMQQIYTRWSFAGRAKMSFVNRVSCLDGVLYWSCSFPFRLLVLAAPVVYWTTGTPVIDAHIDALVYYQLPFTIAICTMMFVLSERRVVPILSDVGQMISSFVIMSAAAVALVKPWGHPFKVTPKGKSVDRVVIHWSLALPFLLLAAGIVLGLAMNATPYSSLNGSPGYDINVVWSLVDIVLLLVTAAACVELPRSHATGFPTREDATLLCGDVRLPCVVTNVSVEGAEVTVYDRELAQTATVLLLDDGALAVPIRDLRRMPRAMGLEFALGTEGRRAMIRKLFGGTYDVEVDRIAVGMVIWSMCKRMLR